MSEAEMPIEFGDNRLDPTQRAVRSSAFVQLLETGRPTSATTIAKNTQLPKPAVDDILTGWAERGSAQLDVGRVFGIAGLTVTPTRHAILLPHGERWTWCALDAIGIVGAIGAGTIISQAPKGVVTLSLDNGEFQPDGQAIFIADGYGLTSSVAQWCPLVDFFPDETAAEDWGSRNRVAGRGVPVPHVAKLAADRWRTIIEGS